MEQKTVEISQNESSSGVKKLKDLVSLVPITDHAKWFESIATLLVNSYAIKTEIYKYRITEIEFYYHDEHHQDLTTYGYIDKTKKYLNRIRRHKESQYKTLTWFFHYSGIDLVFGNKNAPGGILIRAIENIRTGEKATGPLVVYLDLMNQQISADGTKPLVLELVPHEYEKQHIPVTKQRIGLGQSDNAERLYNFSITTI